MVHERSPRSTRSGISILLLALALAGCQTTRSPGGGETEGTSGSGSKVATGGDMAALLVKPAEGWVEPFDQPANVKSVGQYIDEGVTMELESFSAALLEPSPTADFAIDLVPAARRSAGLVSESTDNQQLVVLESQPALKPNDSADKTHFYQRADGAISALGWVNQFFRDVRVTGEVNTQGGARGQGSVSRQGVMARWDLGNNFYWFTVDFSLGVFEIYRARYFGVFAPLEGSTGKIRDFKNTSSYLLEFELVGDTLQGRVYEPGRGGKRGRLVGDTGKIPDREPHYEGVSGFLAEPAIGAPFAPLHASFGILRSEAIGTGRPSKAANLRVADVPQAAQARLERARTLARQGDAEQAISQLNEAIKASPDYVEALNDLAWIRATNEDAKLRDPQEAVRLAEKAVGRLVELYDRRTIDPAAASRFDKNFLIRSGLTLAAAYASAGKFKAAPGAGAGSALLATTVEGVSQEQLRAAMSSSSSIGAFETADWAMSFARTEAAKTRTTEAQQLVQTGEEMLKAFKAGRPFTSKSPLP